MTTPERSVEEIVEEFRRLLYPQNSTDMLVKLDDWLTQTLQTERQKRDEVVEAERERWIKAVGEKIDLPTSKLLQNAFQEGVDYTKEQYDNAIKNLTQTNNPK